MNEALENIAEVFSIFHDGSPEDWKYHNGNVTLKVYCTYLAERIDTSYHHFKVEIHNVHQFKYKPWGETKEIRLMENLSYIEKYTFEISSAEVKNNVVFITCLEDNMSPKNPGGEFIIDGNEIEIFDEGGTQLPLEQLIKISKGYWEDFKTR